MAYAAKKQIEAEKKSTTALYNDIKISAAYALSSDDDDMDLPDFTQSKFSSKNLEVVKEESSQVLNNKKTIKTPPLYFRNNQRTDVKLNYMSIKECPETECPKILSDLFSYNNDLLKVYLTSNSFSSWCFKSEKQLPVVIVQALYQLVFQNNIKDSNHSEKVLIIQSCETMILLMSRKVTEV